MLRLFICFFCGGWLSLWSTAGLFAQKSDYTRKLTEATRLGLSPQKKLSQYQIAHWKKGTGLPQNSVFSIFQSQDGYLWLATYDGLVRFDGLQFENFNTANVSPLLTSNFLDIVEDAQQTLWLGTNNGGLVAYRQGVFQTYTTEQGLPDNTVAALALDAEKNLWIGTRNGLCRREGDAFRVFTSKDNLSSRDITALLSGQDGTLWIGTSRGLSAYRKGQFYDYARNRIVFVNKSITDICEDKQGFLWIGTQAGLVRWDKKKEKYQLFRIKQGLSDDYITKLFLDQRGSLWIGTQGGGLNRLRAGQLAAEQPVFEPLTVKEGLAANSVLEIFEDREGSLWIGLSRGGLNRLQDGKFTNYTSTEGLVDNLSNCVYQDRKGGLWVGTLSGGISYFWEGQFIRSFNKDNGLSSNYVRSITEDQEGNLWVGTYGQGVNVIGLAQNEQNPPIRVLRFDKGLAGDIVRALLTSRDGAVWIGTKTGLSKYQKGTFTTYTRQLGLSDNSIIGLLEDTQGNLWIGTEGAGLNCLRPDQTIVVYRIQNGLANDLVFTIFQDTQADIWVGTKGGLTRIRKGELVSIFARDGLPNDDIHSITEDPQGRLWMSGNNGVFWVKKSELNAFADARAQGQTAPPKLKAVLYQEQEGMKSSDCAASSQPSVLRDRKGRLWYPTTEGLAMIDPARIKKNYLIPPVAIKRLLADNKAYPIKGLIHLPPGTSKFEIDFAALSFLAPDRVRYRYRMVGDYYREDWVETNNRRDAYYTNLPPGNYRFEVQAANNDGVWNRKGAVLSFYLAPYFYQTRLFFLAIAFAFIALALATYFLRIRSLEQSKKALEQSVAERTYKIQTQYEEINQQAQELETINQIAQVINREVKFEKVVQVLLEQGLRLFAQADRGIFLRYNAEKDVFVVEAVQGYSHNPLAGEGFTAEILKKYCQMGLELAEGLFQLHPPIHLNRLSTDYAPRASLAMQIEIDGRMEGLIFFDSEETLPQIGLQDIAKMIRFREHAVSAFEKARILEELENTNTQVANSYRKISDSIRYARRIQKAILPSDLELAQHVADCFVLFKPRDIVSGDFYWVAETVPEPIFAPEQSIGDGQTPIFKGFEEVKTIIAAVDCTGHGVPGAFMTVIGNDLLNQIVLKIKYPGPT
ncbi:MAG: hypothetical protein HC913_06985 [Microscillaceae bacterium]|nr:hypothetical protein [Microscillaceae bacterium]